MKPFLALLLLTCGHSFAQQLAQVPVDATTHLVTYTAVVKATRADQAELLARTKVWANTAAIPGKSALVVREQGTDVVVVIGSQALNTSYFNTSAVPRTLYYTATIALRDGRYQYRLTDFVLETTDNTTRLQPTDEAVEAVFLQSAPPKADGNSYAAHTRKTFDEAIARITSSLYSTLTTSLTANATAGQDW
jgi:hypothetical protein